VLRGLHRRRSRCHRLPPSGREAVAERSALCRQRAGEEPHEPIAPSASTGARRQLLLRQI
jgi:hypothetical protein